MHKALIVSAPKGTTTVWQLEEERVAGGILGEVGEGPPGAAPPARPAQGIAHCSVQSYITGAGLNIFSKLPLL